MADELVDAAKKGDLAKVKRLMRLLEAEEVYEYHWRYGGRRKDALFHALQHGQLEIVKYFLVETRKQHVDEIRFYNRGRIYNRDNNPLHVACRYNHIEIVKYLVEIAKADVNAVNSIGGCGDLQTPLHIACYAYLDNSRVKTRQELVKYLIEMANANVNKRDRKGLAPLHVACKWGALDVVKYLVETQNMNINIRALKGSTPLHSTIYGLDWNSSQRIEIIRYLVRRSPESITKMTNKGEVPLQAVLNQEPFERRALMPILVDPQFPLHFAVAYKRTLLFVKAHVKANPDALKQKNQDGDLPLHAALRAETVELAVIRYMVEQWPGSIKEEDGNGNLPLLAALAREATVERNLVQYLVEQWPGSIKKRDGDGNLPLHTALARGAAVKFNVIQYLVEQWPESLLETNTDGFGPALVAGGSDVDVSMIFSLIRQCPDAVSQQLLVSLPRT